ncbi:MAG: hypothetical protein MI867_04575, partial [Pseudomonadales bacterium]|nr:hypothetical protein [Pseudomonadales bacterium]
MQAQIEHFIRHLYTAGSRIPAESFRAWALEQLQEVVKFDAAFWGTGRLQELQPHYVVQMGLDDEYSQRLKETLDLNPIKDPVLNHLGEPVLMSEVYPDEAFYGSDLYQKLFKPYGIERILASGHDNQRSGLYTLLSLYRFNRDDDFDEQERELIGRCVYHLVAAASYALFSQLERNNLISSAGGNPDAAQTGEGSPQAWAICDSNGFYHEVQDRFLDFIDQYFPNAESQMLPFSLTDFEDKKNDVINGLAVSVSSQGKLLLVGVRPASMIDQ